MTQATAPASPPARSVADLRARFVDARDTTAVVVAAPDSLTVTVSETEAVIWILLVFAGAVYVVRFVGDALVWTITTALLWCADTYTTLRARRGRTQ